MIITPSQAWDRVKQIADREHDQAYDPQHLAAALLDLHAKHFELRREASRALEEIDNQLKRLRADRDEITANVDDALTGVREEVRKLAVRVDDEFTNVDARFQHHPDLDAFKRIDRAVSKLERMFDDLDANVRRLK